MKSIRLIFVAFCCPIAVFCQDITGLWTGTLYNDSSNQYYDYEIAISKENGKYVGFSQTLFLIENRNYFGLKKVKVKIANDGRIVLEDGEMVLNNYPQQPTKNVRQLNVLTLNTTKGEDTLTGFFVTNRTKKFASLTGKVTLKKKAGLSNSEFARYFANILKGEEFTFTPAQESTLPRD